MPNLDGHRVRAITPSLDPESRVTGNPYRLATNEDQSFIGFYVLGTGFILEPEQAQELITKNPHNKDVLFPYLNGEDLNTRPDCSASRWAIDFNDWLIERAKAYPDAFSIIEEKVRPERQRTKPDGSYALRKPLPQRWWQYGEKRPALRAAIADLERVLVIARISSTGIATFVEANQILNEKIVVFASDRPGLLAVLNSQPHILWAWKYSSTLKADLQYTPSDCFNTFPKPAISARLDRIGEELYKARRSVMMKRKLGLTKLYNLVHNPAETGEDVRRLREIHTEVDNAVAEAYGWTDLALGHGFHETRQGLRFTIDPTVQVEVLDRLLELNHQRYAEEAAKGLHDKKGKGRRKRSVPGAGAAFEDGALFPPENALF
jgi:hypothetical protein